MNILEKLEALQNYYTFTRKSGHTTLMKEGTKYTKNKFILSYHKKDYRFLECEPEEIIAIDNLNDLRGHDKPMIIDNGAMSMLLEETVQRMQRLEKENKNLKHKLRVITNVL